jgi:hypothetical protein
MKTRLGILLLPPLAGLLGLMAFPLLFSRPAFGLQVFALIGKAFATAGCVLAAAQFDRGDYLRRAWTLLALCCGILLLNTLLMNLLLSDLTSPASELARGTLTFLGNLLSVAGMISVALAWSKAGLEPPVSRLLVLIAMGVALLAGLSLAGQGAWVHLKGLVSGQLSALAPLASMAGNVTSLVVIVPISLTAFALRGGTLAWPWAAQALTATTFVVYDGVELFGRVLSLAAPTLTALTAAVVLTGYLFQFSAGLLQRMVMQTRGTTR